MTDDNFFVTFMQAVFALVILGALFVFIFFSGMWYAQSSIDNWRCNVLFQESK
jgi:hypothetical protein